MKELKELEKKISELRSVVEYMCIGPDWDGCTWEEIVAKCVEGEQNG